MIFISFFTELRSGARPVIHTCNLYLQDADLEDGGSRAAQAKKLAKAHLHQ
jgi:hypothetical protein